MMHPTYDRSEPAGITGAVHGPECVVEGPAEAGRRARLASSPGTPLSLLSTSWRSPADRAQALAARIERQELRLDLAGKAAATSAAMPLAASAQLADIGARTLADAAGLPGRSAMAALGAGAALQGAPTGPIGAWLGWSHEQVTLAFTTALHMVAAKCRGERLQLQLAAWHRSMAGLARVRQAGRQRPSA